MHVKKSTGIFHKTVEKCILCLIMAEKMTDEVAVRVRSRLLNGVPGNPPINHRSRFERTPLCAKEVVAYAT